MILYPLTPKGGVFVLKLGSFFKENPPSRVDFSFVMVFWRGESNPSKCNADARCWRRHDKAKQLLSPRKRGDNANLSPWQRLHCFIICDIFSTINLQGAAVMNIVQSFYDNMASEYDKLFLDWQATTKEQAVILDKIFCENGYHRNTKILDCACGIGTQAIGLAALGYDVTGSDISDGELAEAKARAAKNNVSIRLKQADFCALSDVFSQQFDIVIAMDNALPHMLSQNALATAIQSIAGRVKPGGMFVASIRDYDALLAEKPPYSPPYIHQTDKGQRVSFQTWDWNDDCYKLTQYIIDDGDTLQTSKFVCEYRATRRDEMTDLLYANGCSSVVWKFPEETGFYQPIVIASK